MKIIFIALKRLVWFVPLLALGLFQKKDKGFFTSWETGYFRQEFFKRDLGLCNPPYDSLVDNSRAHTGSRSARFVCQQDYNDCQGSPRTDMAFPDNLHFKWCDFWIYLDSSYTISDPNPELFFQVHHRTDHVKGQRVPMGMWINDGNYQLNLQFYPNGAEEFLPNKGLEKVQVNIGEVAPDANKWTHWTFYSNLSAGEDGVWRIWKNGKQIYERLGPNYNLNQDSWYYKIGIYKWRWKIGNPASVITRRVWWLDDLKVGTEENTIEDFIN